MTGAPEGTPERRTVAVGSAVGTTIENYDFTAFGTAAAVYFGDAFFPGGDPVAGTLLSFATLGVGFAVRPLGGLIGGHLGDRIGRRPVLLGALVLMGAATFLIGLLPTYAQVGVFAPILLTLLRVLQGLAFGAEWGGAILLTYEHAPGRRRGAYCAVPQAGIPFGLLLANIVFFSVTGWESDWAWRIPFLASAVLVVAGIVIRLRVGESPEFERIRDDDALDRSPLRTVVREQWRQILQVIGMRMSQAGGFYVVVTYFTSYLTDENLTSDTVAIGAIVVAAGIGTVVTPLYGRLTDTIGRRPLYLVGTTGAVLVAFPSFLLLNTGALVPVVIAYVLGLSVFHDLQSAAQGAWFPELFHTGTRTSGASIGYQFSAALAGFVPFGATAAAAGFGWPGVATLYALLGLCGLVAALTTRETWDRRARAAVADAERKHREESYA